MLPICEPPSSHQRTNREYTDRVAIANHSEFQLSEAHDVADPRITSRAKVLPGSTLTVSPWSESFGVAVKRILQFCQSAKHEPRHQSTTREDTARVVIANHSELQLSEAHDVANPRIARQATNVPTGSTLTVM